MRVAILSDLHANRQALDAVVKDAADQRVDEYWCLGDVVGYGANPRETLAWTEKHATLVVKGNHDHAVATGELQWFNDAAAGAARFHAQLLDPDERNRIFAWPLSERRDIDGTSVLLVHASVDDPMREYVLPADAPRALTRWRGEARIILMGHTHVPFAASLRVASGSDGRAMPQSQANAGEGAQGGAPNDANAGAATAGNAAAPWAATGFPERIQETSDTPGAPLLLVNPGSIGQPRDGDPRASYAILDFATRTVELRRVMYDIEAAAQAIHRAGLPTSLALRLYRGR